VKDVSAARMKLKKANVVVTLSGDDKGGYMRVSPSVFNNADDITRLVTALS
jgi:hypothetical protein